MNTPMLQIMNLRKSFGKKGQIKILKGIDFSLSQGERVVILGPSGSGKSTFLRCINHIEEPTSGEMFFEGTAITHQNICTVRQEIGMVFQHFNLISNLTVMENLLLAPYKLHTMSHAEAIKKAHSLLRHIDLLDKEDAYPASLSGGQKQRIAIIRSLMLSPKIILFDEPTSALDPESIGDVLDLIKEVAKDGMTIMIVTHEISFAKEIATRVVFIDEGRIIEDAPPNQFFAHPTTKRVQEFLGKVL